LLIEKKKDIAARCVIRLLFPNDKLIESLLFI